MAIHTDSRRTRRVPIHPVPAGERAKGNRYRRRQA